MISPTLESVVFIDNQAVGSTGFGGGVFAHFGDWTMNDVYFYGNSAIWGGGFYSYIANTKTTNAKFKNNDAKICGGGLNNYISQSVMTNTLFSGNKSLNGGGICNFSNKSTYINTTLSGNYATGDGGGMLLDNGSDSHVYNSIFWNNQDKSGPGTISATIYIDSNDKITLTNSILESSGGSGSWALDAARYIDGGFNKDTDPLFVSPVDPASAPTANGDFHLPENSPAIDMGDNAYIYVMYDLDRNGRIADGDGDGTATVDMGVYELLKDLLYLPIVLR
jgi:hypothetical protein